jgi:AraC-like DNA-binding protein
MSMIYRVYDFPWQLKSYVRYFWSIDHKEDGGIRKTIKIFADRFPRLIFQNLDGHVITEDEQGAALPESFLSGIITKQTSYMVTGSYAHFGVSFYPHAIKAIFGIDAYEMTDSLPDLINFCPGQMISRLQEATTHDLRVGIISEFLLSRLIRQKDACAKINPIIHSGYNYNTPISQILSNHKITERSLERHFKNIIGITPKKYLRILRFEKVVEMLNAPMETNLSEFAYNFNYADQSHFNKEFKDFSGFTPSDFQVRKKFGQESASFLLK